MDTCLSDPRQIIVKSHVNWGQAPAQQLKRVLADSEGGNMHLANYVGEGLGQRQVCRAFAEAPRTPLARTSTFSEKLQVDLLSLDDVIALRVMGVFPQYSLLLPVRSKNPQEVWGASCNAWVGVIGQPKNVQIDVGGESHSEARADSRSGRRIKLQFRGGGLHAWILERRSGLARGICNRLAADDRFSGLQISAEGRRRLNTVISGSGYSANQLVFGSNPVDLLWMGRQGRRSDLCPGRIPSGPIGAAMEIAHDGTGGNVKGSGRQKNTQVADV